ncbi:MAG TPA: HAD family acid phosphatase [Acidobacteriaceae bacterium]|jgi:hypothetical protein|nr:HAD family acid phosphatase [Acidobacteriaceae bacterium]
MISDWCRVRTLVFSLGLLAAAVGQAQTVVVPKELPNLGKLQAEVGKLQAELKDYHDCRGIHGCYATDLDREAATATAALDRIARAWRPGTKLALVLDIDETSLSNYSEMAQADFAYNAAVWDRWVETAGAPAIPGTLRLYREAERLGVAVFFITGRPETQRAATEKNLRSQGYTQWAGLAMRNAAQAQAPTAAFKSGERGKIVAAGYRIAVNVGDQMSDLNGSPGAEVSVKLADPFYYIP